MPSGVRQREVERGVVERVEAGQGDELEGVSHRAQLLLEAGDRVVVEWRQLNDGEQLYASNLSGHDP